MNQIEFKLENTRGAYYIDEAGTRIAEMGIGINDDNLIVYHTQVSEKLKGQGVASQMLQMMVEYARANKLKVVPLCPYVLAQFQRHPEKYLDVWNQNWHK